MKDLDIREVAEDLSTTEEQVLQEGLEALLRKRLRLYHAERFTICQKYGVNSLEDMDRLIREGQVEEGQILEDFQRVDYLTWLINKIEARLEQLAE
jgi:hypothetical protein